MNSPQDYNDLLKVLRIQQTVTKFITKPGLTLEESLEKTLKVFCKAFRWHAAFVWLKGEKEQLDYFTHWCTRALEKTELITEVKKYHVRQGRGPTGYAYKHRRVKLIPRIGNRPRGQRLLAAYSARLKSAATFPIIVDQKVIGVIELFGKKIYEENPQINEFTETLCAQLGQLIKRRQHNELLALNEERYRTLVELAPDIIYALDENNNISSLNNAFEKKTGYKKEEFIGEALSALFVEEEQALIKTALEKNRTTKQAVALQARLNNKYGREIHAEIVESPSISGGKKVKRLGSIRDITDRITLENQKEMWVAMATHELKTPLTSIKAFTQIMQSKEQDPTKAKYLAKVNFLTDSMTNIIDDFLEVTRIKTNDMKIQKTRFSLSNALKDIVETLKPSIEHNIQLHVEADVTVLADRKRLTQVFYNLVTNAVKYSPDKKLVIIKTIVENKFVIISVQDFGIGIKEGQLKKIFGAFYRTRSSEGAAGLGLGLFITEAVVKAHNGLIWVESEEGQGSIFYVKLPL